MTYLSKDKWDKLDELLDNAGCCGYHDCCIVLKSSIKIMAKLTIKEKIDLKQFLNWLDSCNDLGKLFEKLSVFTTLLYKTDNGEE